MLVANFFYSVQPSTVAIGKVVSGEALDALSTISVLNMSCEGNVLAQELLKKIDHHLREIVKAGEGDRHWPEKFKAYCKVSVYFAIFVLLSFLRDISMGHSQRTCILDSEGLLCTYILKCRVI